MPQVAGLLLEEAQASLEAAAVLNPSALGYFGTWPITLEPVEALAALTADSEIVTADSLIGADGNSALYPPLTVTGQSPQAGASVPANADVTLWVVPPPLGFAYPAQNWSAF